MPIKIGFEVISSSGEDENFRASELNHHGPSVRGWRSSANASYPQHLMIKLKLPATLHQIQMLAHQYLIPEKVDICTSRTLNFDGDKTEFEYLGFITFSDNKVTGFRSRELKSIFIPAIQARYIKLIIYSNHVNVKNIYNQVALIAVNVLGDPVQHASETNNFLLDASHSGSVSHNLSYFSPYDDLAFEMYVDQDTANVIKILEAKKLQAVRDEQFDCANSLKITIKNLRAAGEILGLYEQEKKQAINREDYDRAKRKKLQMENFRKKIYCALNIQHFFNSDKVPRNRLEVNEFEEQQTTLDFEDNVLNKEDSNFELPRDKFDSKNNNCISNTKTQENSFNKIFHSKSQTSVSTHLFNVNSVSASTSYPRLDCQQNNEANSDQYDGDLSSRSPSVSSYSDSSENECSPYKSIFGIEWPGKVSESQSLYAFANPSTEDQTVFARRKFRHDHDIRDSISPMPSSINLEKKEKVKTSASEYTINNKESAKQLTRSIFEAYEERTLPALKSYHGNEMVRNCQLALDIPKKSTLNEKEKKQASLPISVFGMDQIEKFYSKNFNDKEEGLKWLQQELRTLAGRSNKEVAYNKVARAATFLLHRALRDKVFSVYSLAAETVRLLFVEYVPQRVAPSEVARSVEKLFPELLLKSGDVMPRIHNMAAHTLLTMAECKEVRCLNIIPVHLSRPLTASVHPRLALSRLEMVEQLILSQGISKEKKSGLSCRTLAEFGSSGLHHPAEPVRKVSERILLQVYQNNPRIVRKQLPPDDNVTRRNLLYRHLFQKFDEIDLKKKLQESNCNDVVDGNSTSNFEGLNDHFYLQDEKKDIILSKEDNCNLVNDLKLKNDVKNNNKPLKLVQVPSVTVKKKGREEERKALGKTNGKLVNFQKQSLKFPSLADSIDATKARMLLKQKFREVDNKKPRGHLEETKHSALEKKYNKKSFIPLPVTKLTSDSNIKHNTSPSSTNNVNQISKDKQKHSLFESKLPRKILKENSSGVQETNSLCIQATDEGRVMEDTAKLSDSMISSIREMENSLGYHSLSQSKLCIFCMSSKQWNTEESLTNHYLRDCLMLITCKHCKQVTEISTFTNHLINDCNKSHLFVKCKNCQEAILKESFETHKCFATDGTPKSRCPFCHTTIENEDAYWRKHLVEGDECSKHPRKLLNSHTQF